MDIITKLNNSIELYNSRVFNKLKKALSIDELSSFMFNTFKNSNEFLLNELFKIYSWKGGIVINQSDDYASSYYVIPNYYLNSPEIISKIIEDDNFYNFRSNGMIPLFSSGHGEYLCIYFDDIISKGLFNSKVYLCSTNDIEIDNITSIFDTFDIMIEIAILAYEKGFFYQVNDFEFDTYWDISSKLNPQSEYWNRG